MIYLCHNILCFFLTGFAIVRRRFPKEPPTLGVGPVPPR